MTFFIIFVQPGSNEFKFLQPENILLDKDGHIVLTDFGLCKDNLDFNDTTATLCGSLDYLSPV